MDSAVVTNQVAQHANGLFGADTFGVVAIVLAIAACIVLGFGLRMLMKSRQHSHANQGPYPQGRGPRYGSRGR